MNKFDLTDFLATITVNMGIFSISYRQYIKELKKTI